MNKTHTLHTGSPLTTGVIAASCSEARWRLGLGVPRDVVAALARERGALIDGRVVIDAFRGAPTPCPAPSIKIIERLNV
jgi:hypothetical protein